MTTKESITSARGSVYLFLVAQIVPPMLMFSYVFGHWGIGVSMIIGIPMLYSAVRIPLLLYRKQFHLLLRPALTLLLSLIIVGMGNYYANEAARYVDQLAREMQQQCNRDGVCKLPPGKWRVVSGYPASFEMRTDGAVPMRVLLEFGEYDHNKNSAQCSDCKYPTAPSFKSFHLVRMLEDQQYDVYGGVGRPLKTQRDD